MSVNKTLNTIKDSFKLNNLKKLSLNVKTPIIICLIYAIYIFVMNAIVKNKTYHRKKLSSMTFFMLAHNLGLCLYSAMIFKKSYAILSQIYKSHTFDYFLSDPESLILKKMDSLTYSFYISKYYEIFDTFILHLNRKQCSFLQGYHHIGVIFTMYLQYIAKQHVSYIIVLLNSLVHTVMYFYYGLSCLGIRLPFKKYITSLQIFQFLAGELIYFSHVVKGDIFDKENFFRRNLQILTGGFSVFYVLLLIFLFNKFYSKTYKPKEKTD